MNIRALAIVGVVVVVVGSLLYWATYVRLDTWKCFHPGPITEPTPHIDADDHYCIAYRGPASNRQWFLLPGDGMDNWRGIGGVSKRIRLDATTDEELDKVFEFDLHVTDHMNPSDGSHQHEHKKPNFGYELTVILPDVSDLPEGVEAPKATATFKVGGGGRPIHAGTAHTEED